MLNRLPGYHGKLTCTSIYTFIHKQYLTPNLARVKGGGGLNQQTNIYVGRSDVRSVGGYLSAEQTPLQITTRKPQKYPEGISNPTPHPSKSFSFFLTEFFCNMGVLPKTSTYLTPQKNLDI